MEKYEISDKEEILGEDIWSYIWIIRDVTNFYKSCPKLVFDIDQLDTTYTISELNQIINN